MARRRRGQPPRGAPAPTHAARSARAFGRTARRRVLTDENADCLPCEGDRGVLDGLEDGDHGVEERRQHLDLPVSGDPWHQRRGARVRAAPAAAHAISARGLAGWRPARSSAQRRRQPLGAGRRRVFARRGERGRARWRRRREGATRGRAGRTRQRDLHAPRRGAGGRGATAAAAGRSAGGPSPRPGRWRGPRRRRPRRRRPTAAARSLSADELAAAAPLRFGGGAARRRRARRRRRRASRRVLRRRAAPQRSDREGGADQMQARREAGVSASAPVRVLVRAGGDRAVLQPRRAWRMTCRSWTCASARSMRRDVRARVHARERRRWSRWSRTEPAAAVDVLTGGYVVARVSSRVWRGAASPARSVDSEGLVEARWRERGHVRDLATGAIVETEAYLRASSPPAPPETRRENARATATVRSAANRASARTPPPSPESSSSATARTTTARRARALRRIRAEWHEKRPRTCSRITTRGRNPTERRSDAW